MSRTTRIKMGVLSILIILFVSSMAAVTAEDAASASNISDAISKNKHKLTEDATTAFSDAQDDDIQEVIIEFNVPFNASKLEKFTDVKVLKDAKVVKAKAKAKNLADLITDPDVKYVELDQNITSLSETVPSGVNATLAPTVWNQTTGQGVKIAILDTGIAPHEDLAIAGGTSIVSDDYTDTNGHGTAVAGVLAAAQNDVGIVGVAPGAEIYAVKIINGSSGKLSDAIAGVQWAIDHNMSIVLMSFGTDSYSQIFKEALDDASNYGLLLIAASGNDNGPVLYPAAYSSVIAVGAVDENNEKAFFSNYGHELELVARGMNITTTGISSYIVADGTSLAAPHVAGVAALLWAYNRSLTNRELRTKLQNDALDLGAIGSDDNYGYGFVQAKIDATNYIIHNNAYSYEIYNISKFGSPDQSVVLWIKGNGTYEDVNLSTGCYIITIFSPDPSNRTIHVSENGTIRSLLFSVIWENDSYTAYGGNDGQTWLNGWMNFQCTDCAWRQVVCYDYNYNGTTIVSDECWATSYSALTACRGIDNDINSLCNRDSSKCHNTGIADVHNYPSTNLNTAHAEKFAGKTYDTCSAGNWTWDFATLFVIDHLNTSCIDNSNWCVQGAYYGSGNTQWTRLQDISCGTGTSCDSAIAGYVTFNKSYNYISSNNGSHYPCKIADGYACNVTADCLTGHSCISGTCGANGSTDLAIVNITPIQTVSNVKLVMGKSGFVVVEVKNNGPNNSTAEVGLTFDGSSLAITHKVIPATNQNSIWKNDSFVTITNRSTLAVNETKWFVFDFTPPYYCTNKTLNASVVIAS